MSGPKLTRIFDEMVARVSQITQLNGYSSDIGERVFVDNRQPQENELPCAMVSMGVRNSTQNLNCASNCDMTLTVVGYVATDSGDAYLQAIDVLGDIQRAVEQDDPYFGNLLGSQYGLAFESDEILYPIAGSTVIATRVSYSAPHIRRTGDPEIK